MNEHALHTRHKAAGDLLDWYLRSPEPTHRVVRAYSEWSNVAVTHSFDDWVNSLRFQGDVPPDDLPAGTTAFLREVYDRDGPVSRDDVADAWDEKQQKPRSCSD